MKLLFRLFRCVACEDSGLTLTSFPLCSLCERALVHCPRLCSRCAGLSCPEEFCSRPWIVLPPEIPIRSYSAKYVLIGRGFGVLKKWKIHAGPAFDRKVLNRIGHSTALIHSSQSFQKLEKSENAFAKPGIEFAKSEPELGLGLARLTIEPPKLVIVPVPQSPRRSRVLRGNPAERIAHALSQQTGLSWMRALEPPEHRAYRQAERSAPLRYEDPLSFKAIGPAPFRVILVDDFMTTGKTLRTAAYALARAGTREIDVFCLGVRPLKSHIGHNQ